MALASLCINVPDYVPSDPSPGGWGTPVAENSTTLPIEVFGPDTSTRTFTLTLGAGQSASTTGLKLKVHNLSYDDKMSVKINSGSWKTLNDNNVTYTTDRDKGFWGMGGIQGTLEFIVSLSAGEAIDGNNTITFRFNDLDGLTIGYRVLALNFVAGTTEQISAGFFTIDDPEDWTPPINTFEAITEGQNLWYTAPNTERGVSLSVHCTDCHAHDGRDMKYFNYSNESIIRRSMFHGLTYLEGQKIASYIRNLNVPYETKGRPWNPPYQPSADIDSQPLRSWAAGGGLENVLDSDLAVLDEIWPGGITPINLRNIKNARQIRLNAQLPDWNRWLPQVHPNDAYPSVYPANLYVSIYTTIRNGLIGKSGQAAASYFNSQKSPWDSGSDQGIAKPSTSDPSYPTWAYKRKSIRHWRVIKTWEIMTEYQIEDFGQELFGSFSNDRRWFHGEVFRLGPHVIGGLKDDKFYAESMQWYQTQLILNDGNRRNGSIVPIDWGYQHSLNQSSWNNLVGLPTPWLTYGMLVLNVIKGGEVGANDLIPAVANSWQPEQAHTHRLAPGSTMAGLYATIPVTTRRAVANAILPAWLDECQLYTREQYLIAKAPLIDEGFKLYLYYLIVNFTAIGVDGVLINRICDFGEELFPFEPVGYWDNLRP